VTAIRTAGEPCRAGEFVVPSESHPGESWRVLWITEGTAHCFCPGFAHRGRCRHLNEVALAIEIEARQTSESERAIAALKLQELERVFSR